MQPKLSIITIGYNAPRTELTCRSIQEQTWQEFEWIVVDGGSETSTLEIWQHYRERMQYFCSERDQGIYNAMNKGIQRATGQYLLFLNAGDALHDSEVLAKVFANETPTAQILYGDVLSISARRQKIRHFPEQVDLAYFLNDYISHNTTFIQRELFVQYGGYDETLQIVADWEKWLCFAMHHCSFTHLPLVVGDFYLDGISAERSVLQARERRRVLTRYCPDYELYQVQTSFVKLFRIIPLLKIEQRQDIRVVKLFNYLPIATIKTKSRIELK